MISSIADASALGIVHDTFVEMVTTNIHGVAGLQASVAFQPVTKNFIQQGINKGGNPQGLDITKAPYFCKSRYFIFAISYPHAAFFGLTISRDG